MAPQEQINVAPVTDEERAIATITLAFSSDSAVRWLFPNANQYLTYWPPFVRAFAGKAFANGTADSVDDCGGVAMWLPPGVGPDDEGVGEILAEAVPATAQEETRAFFGQTLRPGPTPCVPRGNKPAEQAALRAPRIRRTRRDPGRQFAPVVAYGREPR